MGALGLIQVGLGVVAYFGERWNVFDIIVVAVSLVGLMMGGDGGGGASVLRVFRIARLFRVARFLEGLRMLFETLIVSLPSLGNVVALMFLVMVVRASLPFFCISKVTRTSSATENRKQKTALERDTTPILSRRTCSTNPGVGIVKQVYAILGVNLFGKVKFGEYFNSQANFRTFGNALMVLMRMITGEGWNFIMYDTMNLRDCDHSLECAVGDCCGSPVAATIFFITFTLVRSPSLGRLHVRIGLVQALFSAVLKE